MGVRVGTSGWHYPSGRGTWTGVFYPARPASALGRRAFDELAYYAEHFDTVEVNATFYRVPSPAVTRSWASRTPPGFQFAIKLFRKFTHPAMYGAATGEAVPKPDQADVDQFLRAIDPLAAAGKLGPLLAQFPPSFRYDAEHGAYLDWLLDRFAGLRAAVELRHRSWSDAAADTRTLLDAHGATLALIDEPKFSTSIRQDLRADPPGLVYMRLHGRNRAQWWSHDEVEDRYDYLYTMEELEPFIEAADRARRLERPVYVFLNNHFEAKGVANAVMIRHRLGLPLPGTYPETFLERFPEVRPMVASAGADQLF